MSEETPPLKVWIYPLSAVAIILLWFFSYAYTQYGPYARVVALSHRNLEQALIENTSDTSALSIVIVGSSLTESALFDAKEIEYNISKATNKKAKVLRVALNYMNMDMANRIHFFEYVTKYPPNYLFIENTFNITNTDSSSTLPVPVDAALLHIRNNIRGALGMPMHDNYYTKWYTYDEKPLPGADFYTDRFDSITFRFLKTDRQCVVRKPTRNAAANDAYEVLMRRKTKVIFLAMPQSSQLTPNYLDSASTSQLNDVLTFYNTRFRIGLWRFPKAMPDSCFTDGAHLNSKGATQYQEWFVSEFASKI